jgi:hypothetical protein
MKSSTGAQRIKKHRDKLRRSGLRLVQMWVPDTRAPGFAAECRRQSLIIKNSPHEKQIMDWVEKVADTTGWK